MHKCAIEHTGATRLETCACGRCGSNGRQLAIAARHNLVDTVGLCALRAKRHFYSQITVFDRVRHVFLIALFVLVQVSQA